MKTMRQRRENAYPQITLTELAKECGGMAPSAIREFEKGNRYGQSETEARIMKALERLEAKRRNRYRRILAAHEHATCETEEAEL